MLGSSSCLNGVWYFHSGSWRQMSIPWKPGCCWDLHIILSPHGGVTGVHSESMVLQSVGFDLFLHEIIWLPWLLTLASPLVTFELNADGSCSCEKTWGSWQFWTLASWTEATSSFEASDRVGFMEDWSFQQRWLLLSAIYLVLNIFSMLS